MKTIRIRVIKNVEKIPGGLGAKLKGTMKEKHQQIADMHGVSIEEIESQLEMGIKAELEHTTDQDIAHEIAMDHLIEDPKYYTKLDTIEEKKKRKKKSKGKKDACYHKVRSRYDVWPSAYASGALVKCRKVGAKNWGKSKKNEELELDERKKKKRKLTYKPSSESSLHDWFGRKGAKGKKKGWVDCNSPDGKGGYKSCGRQKGEKRKKYPSCRPTPASCKKHKSTKGKSWGKKSAKGKKG